MLGNRIHFQTFRFSFRSRLSFSNAALQENLPIKPGLFPAISSCSPPPLFSRNFAERYR
jgi:hypothetical protein